MDIKQLVHSENKLPDRVALWQRLNPDKHKANAKRYRERNKNKISDYQKKYRQNPKNKEKMNESMKRYRARLREESKREKMILMQVVCEDN